MGTDSASDLETLAEALEAGDVTVTRAAERAEVSLWEFVQHVRKRDTSGSTRTDCDRTWKTSEKRVQ